MNNPDPYSAPPLADMDDSPILTSRQAQALVRLMEAAPQVQRRHHFFIWMQTHVSVLIPHTVAVCGAYQRQRRDVVFEVFDSVALPAPLLAALGDGASELLRGTTQHWLGTQGRAYALPLDDAASGLLQADTAPLRQAGLGHIVVHGVARPQRINEIESFFVLAGATASIGPHQARHLELLLPHLHATYLRVQSVEREMSLAPRPAPAAVAAAQRTVQITARERQVLQGVREGRSNQQISEVLGISPLTVKNHIQKILRKLGANNRAQAVALTMAAGGPAAQRGPLVRTEHENS